MNLVVSGPTATNTWSWRWGIVNAAELLDWTVRALDPAETDDAALDAALDGADWFIHTHAQKVDPLFDLNRAWARCEADDIVACGYSPDRVWGLPWRERRIETDRFWRAPVVITQVGDPEHQARFDAAGICHRWAPTAVSDDYVGAYTFRAELACDVAFLGRAPNGKWRDGRAALLEAMTAHFGDRFRWYADESPHGARWGIDALDAIGSARVVLGDEALPHLARTWSDRVPVSLAQGAPLVQPYTDGLADAFYDGLWTYPHDDPATAVEVCETVLAQDKLWREGSDLTLFEQTSRGMHATRTRHTWSVRLTELWAMLTEGLDAHG